MGGARIGGVGVAPPPPGAVPGGFGVVFDSGAGAEPIGVGAVPVGGPGALNGLSRLGMDGNAEASGSAPVVDGGTLTSRD